VNPSFQTSAANILRITSVRSESISSTFCRATATGKIQKNVLRERFWKGKTKHVG